MVCHIGKLSQPGLEMGLYGKGKGGVHCRGGKARREGKAILLALIFPLYQQANGLLGR